jgi:IS5 family transposase
MKLFEPLVLKFEQANWASSPEFGLIDTILEQRPEIIKMAEKDVTGGCDEKQFGRKDTPSVEQIVRAALFKEMKNLDYRELEFAQEDSRICEQFVKIDPERPYSFQVYQKYISRITVGTLEKMMVAINRIAIEEGLEDVKQFRQDSTVIETNIHYPTNNSLVWDCIDKSQRLLEQLEKEVKDIDLHKYRKRAKKVYFQINVTKEADKRVKLFAKQLKTFTLSIEQVTNIVKKKFEYGISNRAKRILIKLEEILTQMNTVYSMAERKELLGEKVPASEKLFSIYELHTDIIVKGGRDVQFGHKVNLGTGKSNLILTCEVVSGNPKDSSLYVQTIDAVKQDYQKVPESVVTDGGYGSLENYEYAEKQGIANIVFNKIVGSLKNKAKSVRMENKLKKWRSGIEAVISNLKRGFDIRRCVWKGLAHFKQKVLWSVIAYNIRVMTGAVLKKLSL